MIDAQIVKDIIEHLSWDTRVDALNIQVSANDGRVQLSGTVPGLPIDTSRSRPVMM
jgi:osmotically-inducible protein OsmY